MELELDTESNRRATDIIIKTIASSISRADRDGDPVAFVTSLGALVAESLLDNDEFLGSLSLTSVESAPEWCSTEEFARMAGFSRTSIVILLDSEEFEAHVVRSLGGHRRVKRAAAEAWIHGNAKALARRAIRKAT